MTFRILCGALVVIVELACCAAFRDLGYARGKKDGYQEGHKDGFQLGWKDADSFWLGVDAATKEARENLWREELQAERKRQWP